MKVIKNINNNVSLCLDNQGKEVVVFGKGVGFTKPYQEVDSDKVQRIFYGIDESYVQMLNEISGELLEAVSKIVDYAKANLENRLRENLVLTLADHIAFTMKRNKEQTNFQLSINQDIQRLFEKEIAIGERALVILKKELGITLPKEEAVFIALHIINAEMKGKKRKRNHKISEEIIDEIAHIIETQLNVKLNKEGFSYSRFVTHMYYLIKRGERNELIRSENFELYESLIKIYPEIFECTQKIRSYLLDFLKWKLTDEECIYLMLHINRLCAREDCYH